MNEGPETNESGYDGILFTADIVAAMRGCMDSEYDQRIYEAARLSKLDPRVMRAETFILLIQSRQKTIEKIVRHMKTKQVMLFASGLSPQGLMYTEDPSVTCLETDLKGNIEKKEDIVSSILWPPRPNLQFMSADVTNAADVTRAASSMDPNLPCAVVLEGVLSYFSENEMHQVVANLSQLLRSHPRWSLIFELNTQEGLSNLRNDMDDASREILSSMSRQSGRDLWSPFFRDKTHAVGFFRKHGLELRFTKHGRGHPDIIKQLKLPGGSPIDKARTKTLLESQPVCIARIR